MEDDFEEPVASKKKAVKKKAATSKTNGSAVKKLTTKKAASVPEKKKAVKKTEPVSGVRGAWKTLPHTVTGEATRGFLKEYVEFAKKRKNFKLQTLIDQFGGEVGEERVTRYFVWCRNNQIFAEV